MWATLSLSRCVLPKACITAPDLVNQTFFAFQDAANSGIHHFDAPLGCFSSYKHGFIISTLIRLKKLSEPMPPPSHFHPPCIFPSSTAQLSPLPPSSSSTILPGSSIVPQSGSLFSHSFSTWFY